MADEETPKSGSELLLHETEIPVLRSNARMLIEEVKQEMDLANQQLDDFAKETVADAIGNLEEQLKTPSKSGLEAAIRLLTIYYQAFVLSLTKKEEINLDSSHAKEESEKVRTIQEGLAQVKRAQALFEKIIALDDTHALSSEQTDAIDKKIESFIAAIINGEALDDREFQDLLNNILELNNAIPDRVVDDDASVAEARSTATSAESLLDDLDEFVANNDQAEQMDEVEPADVDRNTSADFLLDDLDKFVSHKELIESLVSKLLRNIRVSGNENSIFTEIHNQHQVAKLYSELEKLINTRFNPQDAKKLLDMVAVYKDNFSKPFNNKLTIDTKVGEVQALNIFLLLRWLNAINSLPKETHSLSMSQALKASSSPQLFHEFAHIHELHLSYFDMLENASWRTLQEKRNRLHEAIQNEESPETITQLSSDVADLKAKHQMLLRKIADKRQPIIEKAKFNAQKSSDETYAHIMSSLKKLFTDLNHIKIWENPDLYQMKAETLVKALIQFRKTYPNYYELFELEKLIKNKLKMDLDNIPTRTMDEKLSAVALHPMQEIEKAITTRFQKTPKQQARSAINTMLQELAALPIPESKLEKGVMEYGGRGVDPITTKLDECRKELKAAQALLERKDFLSYAAKIYAVTQALTELRNEHPTHEGVKQQVDALSKILTDASAVLSTSRPTAKKIADILHDPKKEAQKIIKTQLQGIPTDKRRALQTIHDAEKLLKPQLKR